MAGMRDQLRTRQTTPSVPLPTNAFALQVSPGELKAAILLFYSLSGEQERRLFAGLESIKLGHGGANKLLDQNVSRGRTRRSGGGRKPAEKINGDIVTLIKFLLGYDTAGDPITGLKWSRCAENIWRKRTENLTSEWNRCGQCFYIGGQKFGGRRSYGHGRSRCVL